MMDKFTLYKENAVLMVIDFQERLVPAMFSGDQVVEKVKMLGTIADRLGIPVIITEQYPKGLGKTIPLLQNLTEDELVFEKNAFSAYTPEVAGALAQLNRKKVIITGIEAHVCVFQTVRDLLTHGFQVFVAEDGVSSRTHENRMNGLSLLSSMGAVVTNVETIFFDLMKEAGTPLFKELSKVIK